MEKTSPSDIAEVLEELQGRHAGAYARLEKLNKAIVRNIVMAEKDKLMRALYGPKM
jgi:hypothetical protein